MTRNEKETSNSPGVFSLLALYTLEVLRRHRLTSARWTTTHHCALVMIPRAFNKLVNSHIVLATVRPSMVCMSVLAELPHCVGHINVCQRHMPTSEIISWMTHSSLNFTKGHKQQVNPWTWLRTCRADWPCTLQFCYMLWSENVHECFEHGLDHGLQQCWFDWFVAEVHFQQTNLCPNHVASIQHVFLEKGEGSWANLWRTTFQAS